ncbi:MAG: AtpZ/AtpI family protein [Deltaproteobacteria bacterium]|nr:AtpZ/AtpI family protein [Deltaproteobacteria bacterium]
MDKNGDLKGLLFLASIGTTMVASVLIGLAIGIYLDRLLSTKPWLTVIFILFGAAAGFKSTYDTIKRYALKIR